MPAFERKDTHAMTRPEVDLAGIKLKNPVLLASGTCGYGQEINDLLDLELLGGLVVKGISLIERPGNPPPRIHETPCGLLNAIGLENVGLERFLSEKLPWLEKIDTAVIVNILGDSVEEYTQIAQRLNGVPGIEGIEVNISCPNVKAGGIAFGADPALAAEVTRRIKMVTSLPVIVKLSPNVTDITVIAKAVEEAGADALSLINTLLGMAIDIKNKRPALANVFGGLSGPAIKPIALRMVWQVARAVEIPVIGIGGISTPSDAIEFFMAGASAIQIGTATLVNPGSAAEVVTGIASFMDKEGIDDIRQIRII